MEIIGFDSLDDMMKAVQKGTKSAIDMMTPAQRKLCDGEEHWAFCLDGVSSDDTQLAIMHIKSRAMILMGEYPEDAIAWFDSEGKASRGYLPCETWDSYYSRPPGEGDLHDRHASTLMEITKAEFDLMWSHKCNMAALAKIPYMMRLFLQFIALYGSRT